MTEPRSRRRDISAALTRSAVLDAARDLFVTNGFDNTSVEAIARASESSNGAVYHHFRDKREIFAELYRQSQTEIMRVTVASMPADASAWHRVELATCAFLDSYVHDEQARVLLGQAIGVLGWDRVRALDEEMAQPLIRATLTEAIRAGEAKDLPVEAAAELLFGVYCNAVLYIASGHDPDKAVHDTQKVILTILGGMRTQTR